jgi:hypothetical protein
VIADCSEKQRFAVLMKKSEDETRVKIITKENVVELQKQPGKQQIVVKVDGQKVDDDEQLQQSGVEKSELQVYVQQRGIQVRFDGEEISIKSMFSRAPLIEFQSVVCTRTCSADFAVISQMKKTMNSACLTTSAVSL